jgi:hypothetical protein
MLTCHLHLRLLNSTIETYIVDSSFALQVQNCMYVHVLKFRILFFPCRQTSVTIQREAHSGGEWGTNRLHSSLLVTIHDIMNWDSQFYGRWKSVLWSTALWNRYLTMSTVHPHLDAHPDDGNVRTHLMSEDYAMDPKQVTPKVKTY